MLILLLLLPFLIGLVVILLSLGRKSSPVILFHDLYERKFPKTLSEFSAENFEKFCESLKVCGYETIQFKERVSHSDQRVSITFDDGYASNRIAADILKKHNLNASFFVCTGHLTGEPITDVYGSKRRVSAEDIRRIDRMGFEIGSHTVHHYDLRLLSDEDLRKELNESKRSIEEIIGKSVVSLSVPYGLWNEKVIRTAKECGYETIAVYNFTAHAYNFDRVFPVTGAYPFDTIEDLLSKSRGVQSASASIIPHFAKGSPLGSFRNVYCKLPFPWFVYQKKDKESRDKQK